MTIPGIGTINATALVAAVGNARAFRRVRDMAACCQITTGGKPRLLGISKRGNRYLRKNLIHGARAVLTYLVEQKTPLSRWAREMLVAQRTQLINALRGHLAEIGVIAAQGLKNARELARVILAEDDETIPACVRAALAPLVRQLHALELEIACSDRTIAVMARDDEIARRLMTIPGLGPVTASGHKRSGCIRFLGTARVRRLSWPDAETKLVRRQGAAGPRLEDGQPIFAETARRGRACSPLSSHAAPRRAAILGEEAHADQVLQACRRRARQ